MESYLKYILFFISIVCLGIGIYFAFLKNTAQMIALFIAAGGLMLFAHLSVIQKGKVGTSGIEIETREVLKEARSTIEELRLLAVRFAAINLFLLQRSGRWGGYDEQEKNELKEEAIDMLEQLGVSDKDIRNSLSGWNDAVEFDYAHYITGGSKVLPGVPAGQLARLKAMRSGGIKGRPSPEELETFFYRM